MRVLHSLSEISRDKNSVVTVGTFDGIHRAHQEIIRELVNRARMREGRSVLITFDPHPKEVVASTRGPVRLLTTLEERIALLEPLNVDLIFVIPFTLEFSRLTSEEFYRQYVVNGMGVSEVVVGYDHMFGRDRAAGIDELVHMGRYFDFSVFAVHAYAVDGETVSSTRIRKALSAGDVEHAERLLGRPYTLAGTVVSGDRRGATLGFPTANIQPLSEKKVTPANGVYIVAVTIGSERRYGMLNIGVLPTVTDGKNLTIEVHLFDFSGELYEKEIAVSFLRRLRDERRFSSLGELTDQLHRDREESLRYIASYVKS